jgi:polyisoprenoid-binding protein YceI
MIAGVSTGSWTVRCAHSTARFAVRNFGFNRVTGTIPIRAGSVRRDEHGTAVEAELDLGALDTGNARRDADLRKPHLLDSAARPVLRFTADRVREEADRWILEGALELRGVACPVTLTARVVDDGAAAAPHLVATAVFDRVPLGMRVPRFVIGRYLELTVDARLDRA